jgi:dienelactone hydrolase
MTVNPCTNRPRVFHAIALALACAAASVHAADNVEATFHATDTPAARGNDTPQMTAILDRVSWEPAKFEVRCTATPGRTYDALVTFDSPLPSGKHSIDRVALRWYAARDMDHNPIQAPAVLMIHTLQPQMLISDQLAQSFAKRGLHTFVLQLPGYGQRRDTPGLFPAVSALIHGRQAVADCLRAKDAISALPNIKPGPIALQGTSLGGFVAATAAGVDPSFDPVVLLITGGDCYGALTHGQRDARFLRDALARQGYAGQALKNLLEPVEPLRVAHRLNPKRTWLISAQDDVTIPKASSNALAQAIGLDQQHRLWINTNHYTTLLMLPAAAQTMADIILNEQRD